MDLINTLSGVGTAVAAGIAAFQLWQGHRQALTTFEDSFARDYRELASTLPAKVFLGEELCEAEHKEMFDEFYRYFDLTNEQVFLRQNCRVSRPTWIFWRDGIQANLERPAFQRAWTEIERRAEDDFKELRSLVRTEFKEDPICWNECTPTDFFAAIRRSLYQ